MATDEETRTQVVALIERTYRAMSTPGSPVDRIFNAPEIAITGSGIGEIFNGPAIAVQAAIAVSSWGFAWRAETIEVWRRGDVAWAQILGTVLVTRAGVEELVPYWTTGVFGLAVDGWQWLYWGGAEPQDPARV